MINTISNTIEIKDEKQILLEYSSFSIRYSEINSMSSSNYMLIFIFWMCYFSRSLQSDVVIFYSNDFSISCPSIQDFTCDCKIVDYSNLLAEIKGFSIPPIILMLLYYDIESEVISAIGSNDIVYFSFIFVPQQSVIDNRLTNVVPSILYDVIYCIYFIHIYYFSC